MKVKEALEYLSKYDPESEIIIDWWDKEWAKDICEANEWPMPTDNEWIGVVEDTYNREYALEIMNERIIDSLYELLETIND